MIGNHIKLQNVHFLDTVIKQKRASLVTGEQKISHLTQLSEL